MSRIAFIFRLVGILFLPVTTLLLGAVIWQNSHIIVNEFSLLGGWWELSTVRLSSLLIWFLGLGAAIVLGFLLLLHSERKLRRKLVELRDIKKKAAPEKGHKKVGKQKKASKKKDADNLKTTEIQSN